MRTNVDISELFTPIEDALKYTFLSAMTGPQPYQTQKKGYSPYHVD